MKDKNEDWGRWKDNVFIGKKPLVPPGIAQQNERANREAEQAGPLPVGVAPPRWRLLEESQGETSTDGTDENTVTTESANAVPQESIDATESPESDSSSTDRPFCPECYLPLHPDPKPETLYIFLHAFRYTTSLGCFQTDLPWWASMEWNGEGWNREEGGA